MSLIKSAWSHFISSSKADLVAQVASLYGVQDDTEMEALAVTSLNGAVDDANMHLWEFNKQEESGIVMTAGQAHVEITDNVYREVLAFIVKASDSTVQQHLTFLPWVDFQRQWGVPTSEGTPLWYSYFNLHRTGQIHLAPTPPASPSTFATDYTLTVQYYRRMPHVSDEDPLYVPREVEQLLVYGGQKRMGMQLQGPSHPDVMALAALESKFYDDLRGVDKRSPDENLCFKLAGRRWPYNPMPAAGNGLPYWWIF